MREVPALITDDIREQFDPSFYLAHNPDVAEAGIDPLEHFVKWGWKEGRDPTPDFSVVDYLEANPDVAAAGINPFWHHITTGKDKDRARMPDELQAHEQEEASATQAFHDEQIAREMEAIRGAFDSRFYLRRNPDIAEAGIDPLEHFVIAGWKEGRDPNSWFSVAYYLEASPDIQDANVNPFYHYMVAGKAEGRHPRHPGGHRVETLVHMRPLEETVKAWSGGKLPEQFLTADEIRARIRAAVGADISALMISVGHDNYLKVPGGVQYCIQHEQDLAGERGFLYLNLFPFQPLPRLAHDDETPDVPVSLVLAGEMIGTAPMSALTEAVAAISDEFGSVEVVVHHLLGHSPEQLAALVRATGQDRFWLWLHDFFTLCPSYTLQRNNVAFCGAPPIESNACRLCLFGEERRDHRARIQRFFDELSVHVIAPSQFMADYWRGRADLAPARLVVREHMKIDWEPHKGSARQSEGPITIAYIGYPGPHKGWPQFETVVRTYCDAERSFRFLYFGTSPITLHGVENIPVQVTAEDPAAMIRALAEHEVDIVLHWASCAETFSFSTFEAFAAGAFVLTNPGSGNVAATVRSSGLGAVLDDEADLETVFTDGRIERMARQARDRRRALSAVTTRSDMTFSVLDTERRE